MKMEAVVSVVNGAELNAQPRILTMEEVELVSGGGIWDLAVSAYDAGVKAAEALMGKEEGWRTGGGF